MNKERFNQLVKDYSHVERQNKDLESLVNQYPYSQPVRMLNLKSSSSLDRNAYQQRIALAAFYTTDRNVLRCLIEKGKVPSDFGTKIAKTIKQTKKVVKTTEKPTAKTQSKKPATSVKAVAKPITTSSKSVDAKHLREEVMVNLEILQQTKATFFKLVDLADSTAFSNKKTTLKKPDAAKIVGKKKANKSVAATASKKAIKPSMSPRTKKSELIDKFIAEEPSITRGKVGRENQSDLSKASSELNEDLVSENLAVILAKQGKTGKAIEIYKKLIWKFPQKKTSFAARIEELKKK